MWKNNTIHYHLSDGVIGVSKPKQEERIKMIFFSEKLGYCLYLTV